MLPSPPQECPWKPQLTVRKGRFGARRDANRKLFVEGWLGQVGYNCYGNRDMVGNIGRKASTEGWRSHLSRCVVGGRW